MNFKFVEWDSSVIKEKPISFKDIASVIYENETQAYRLTRAIMFVREHGSTRLSEMPEDLPKQTWKRYLDDAVMFGLLLYDRETYYPTNRMSNSLRNFADYIEKWEKERKIENPEQLYPTAKKGKEKPRRTKNTD